jgi:copper resistance protein B
MKPAKMERRSVMGRWISSIAVLMILKLSSAWAQESQPSVDHGHHHHHFVAPERIATGATHGGDSVTAPVETAVDKEAMPAMDRHAMPDATPHAGHAMNQNGEPISKQKNSVLPNVRDPHAYSDGYDFGPIPRPKMGDEDKHGSLWIDRLESVTTRNSTAMTYDWQAWYGQTYDRALIRAEGEIEDGKFKDARNELLWAHAVTAYWDTQLGIRYDSGKGTDRGWLAFGVQGLAPYWLYVEATAYVNEQGRTAFRLETEYDLLLTQKLILQPRVEMNFYSRRDDSRDVSSSLSNMEAGLRLRYEIRRELAPYAGIEWASRFGSAADAIRASGKDPEETRLVAGVRFWF